MAKFKKSKAKDRSLGFGRPAPDKKSKKPTSEIETQADEDNALRDDEAEIATEAESDQIAQVEEVADEAGLFAEEQEEIQAADTGDEENQKATSKKMARRRRRNNDSSDSETSFDAASEEVEVRPTQKDEISTVAATSEDLIEDGDMIATTEEVELSTDEAEQSVDEAKQSDDESEEALEMSEEESEEPAADVAGTELDGYESAEIEDVEKIEDEQLDSIIESMLFASDKPVSMATIRTTFKGTNIKTDHIRKSLKRLELDLAGGRRGVSLEEAPGGYQIRTKHENLKFLTRGIKTRFFRVSGPALEVLAIAAYKQPIVKAEIDEIRGVESGHLLRALMEKGLVAFEGKSELPGRPMQYSTTKKFLEIFGLRNLRELPTLSQIDELLPEGIGEEDESQNPKLADLTDKLSEQVSVEYSQGEEELVKITEQLQDITVSSDFFEQEKLRQKQARETERANNIREAILVGEKVSTRDRNWLERFDEALKAGTAFMDETLVAAVPPSAPKAPDSEDVKESDEAKEPPAGASAFERKGRAEQASVGSLISSAASIFKDSGFADDDVAEARFEEEEDRSLDGDLNVDLHDDEGEVQA